MSGRLRADALPGPRVRVTNAYVMATLTIRLPDQLRRELERMARRRGRPAGELVRDSLRRYMAVERFRVLREGAVPYARNRGILTDEDVFKSVS